VNRRRALLGLALVATLALTAWTMALPDTAEPTVEPAASARAVPAVAARVPWPVLTPQAAAAWGVALLQPQVDGPPPVAAAAGPVAAPAPPQAPALPYRWIGRIDDGSGSQVLLAGATTTLMVRETDLIDGQWRVLHIRPDGVDLMWLPGSLPLTLNRPPA
jgi:hypothetical protein